MTSLGLFFVGSVLFVSGLSLLGVVTGKAAAPIHAFVGALLIVVTGFITLRLPDQDTAAVRDAVLPSVGFLLFAFAYLHVAITTWTGDGGGGLGWYCAWSAPVAAFLAAVDFIRFDDPRFGTLWLMWTVLFAAFFLALIVDPQRFGRSTGIVTVIDAFATTTIPGALLLIGAWHQVPAGIVVAAGLTVIAVDITLLARAALQDVRPMSTGVHP